MSLTCHWVEQDAGQPDAGDDLDAGLDAAVEAGVPDTSTPVQEAGVDAGPDAAIDAGRDAAVDAGRDTGVAVVDSGVPSAANRPAASKGIGFFVIGSKLYDGNGNEFRMRGTNKTHQDSWSPSLGLMPSNATRWITNPQPWLPDDPNVALAAMQNPSIGGTTTHGKDVQIPGFWDGTCKSDSGSFDTMVNRWIRDAARYQTFERFMILNIANEWGSDETAWRNAYVAAIPRIRSAGWHGAIMVDAPGCGQNGMAIARHGAAILAADVERNVIFDWHIYGAVFDSAGGVPRTYSQQIDLVPTMDAIAAAGLATVIGEVGPGRNIGASPTLMTPQRIVALAEARGMGWLTWSWDDWDQNNESSSEASFGHIKQGWTYNSDADLTQWGREAKALWLQYGATKATVFN